MLCELMCVAACVVGLADAKASGMVFFPGPVAGPHPPSSDTSFLSASPHRSRLGQRPASRGRLIFEEPKINRNAKNLDTASDEILFSSYSSITSGPSNSDSEEEFITLPKPQQWNQEKSLVSENLPPVRINAPFEEHKSDEQLRNVVHDRTIPKGTPHVGNNILLNKHEANSPGSNHVANQHEHSERLHLIEKHNEKVLSGLNKVPTIYREDVDFHHDGSDKDKYYRYEDSSDSTDHHVTRSQHSHENEVIDNPSNGGVNGRALATDDSDRGDDSNSYGTNEQLNRKLISLLLSYGLAFDDTLPLHYRSNSKQARFLNDYFLRKHDPISNDLFLRALRLRLAPELVALSALARVAAEDAKNINSSSNTYVPQVAEEISQKSIGYSLGSDDTVPFVRERLNSHAQVEQTSDADSPFEVFTPNEEFSTSFSERQDISSGDEAKIVSVYFNPQLPLAHTPSEVSAVTFTADKPAVANNSSGVGAPETRNVSTTNVMTMTESVSHEPAKEVAEERVPLVGVIHSCPRLFENVTLECIARADRTSQPIQRFWWVRRHFNSSDHAVKDQLLAMNGRVFGDDTRTRVQQMSPARQLLHLSKITASDTGLYMCQVSWREQTAEVEMLVFLCH